MPAHVPQSILAEGWGRSPGVFPIRREEALARQAAPEDRRRREMTSRSEFPVPSTQAPFVKAADAVARHALNESHDVTDHAL